MAKSNNNEIKARSKWTLGDIVVHIILVILSVIWVLPIAWIIMISFRGEKGQYVSTLLPKSLTLANYTKLFTDTGILNFMQMFKNTLIIAIFSCIISTAFVLAVSYCMSRMRFRLRKPFMNVALILGMFPGFMAMIAVYYILKVLGLSEGSLWYSYIQAVQDLDSISPRDSLILYQSRWKKQHTLMVLQDGSHLQGSSYHSAVRS